MTATAFLDQNPIVLVDYKNRADWLAARRTAIGASESAALFGVSPYTTKLKLWAEKTGKVQPEDFEDREELDFGTLFEPIIADRYATVTGRKIWQGSPFCIAQHPRLEFVRATPDRFVIEAPDRGSLGILQVKNAGSYNEKDWKEGPPDFVQIQVQHEMAVTGLQWASVAVCIGGNRLKHFDVERSPVFIEELEEQCKLFWDSVVRQEQPPAAEADARCLDTLKALHPNDNGSTIELPPEALDWWAHLEGARKVEASAKKINAEFAAKLLALIGDATYAVLPDGRTLSLKTSARAGYVVEANTFRSLKLEKTAKGKNK